MNRTQHLRCAIVIAGLCFPIRAANTQAVEIKVSDVTGRPLSEAVVQLIAHTSFTPLVVDTVRSQDGRIRIRVPTPHTTLKLYAVKVCSRGYAPQFVTAPFGRRDTLRVVVRLAAFDHVTVRAQRRARLCRTA